MMVLTVLLLIMCAVAVLAALGAGIFVVLLKLGVIVRESARPPYQDSGDYRLDQGREVRPEEDRM